MVAELSLLTAYRADLTGNWVSRIDRLRALLLRIFSELERAFDYTTRTGLALLTRYCTPAAIRAAGVDEISTHLRELGVRRPTIPGMVTKAITAAGAQTVAVQAESTTEQLVTRLARQLLDLDHEIKALANRSPNTSGPTPRPTSSKASPVSAHDSEPSFCHHRRRPRCVRYICKTSRLRRPRPVPNDSGTRTGVLHRPKRYHHRLRHVFFMAAFSAAQREGPSREFHQRKRAEHQRHVQATIALARRLVDVLWALLRDQRQWQPTSTNDSTGIAVQTPSEPA